MSEVIVMEYDAKNREVLYAFWYEDGVVTPLGYFLNDDNDNKPMRYIPFKSGKMKFSEKVLDNFFTKINRRMVDIIEIREENGVNSYYIDLEEYVKLLHNSAKSNTNKIPYPADYIQKRRNLVNHEFGSKKYII